MTKLPENVKNDSVIKSFQKFLIHQGKARDIYQLDAKTLLMVATDRISIFDFVLPALVPQKGDVLTALTHFWLKRVLLNIIPNHLVDCNQYPSRNLAFVLHKFFPEIQPRRSLAVCKTNIMPFEMIFRHHLGGSVYKNYQKTNVPKWTRLAMPLFTPSTKAESGHDINIPAIEFYQQTGEAGRRAVDMLRAAYRKTYDYAEQRGILILDTKFEYGLDKHGNLLVCDEALTPDSSRFTTVEDWETAMKEGREPIFYDKEPVRQWGKTIETTFTDGGGEKVVGINNLDPANLDHVDFVHSLEVPQHITTETTKRYKQIFKMLTKMELEEYQEKYLT